MGAGENSAMRIRIATTWSIWRKMASQIINKSIPLINITSIFCACIRLEILNGTETKYLEEMLVRELKLQNAKIKSESVKDYGELLILKILLLTIQSGEGLIVCPTPIVGKRN